MSSFYAVGVHYEVNLLSLSMFCGGRSWLRSRGVIVLRDHGMHAGMWRVDYFYPATHAASGAQDGLF
jgi:hypothetical protein